MIGRGRRSKVASQQNNMDNKEIARFDVRACLGAKVWNSCSCLVGYAKVEVCAVVVCPL